jgi:hypothetical protein
MAQDIPNYIMRDIYGAEVAYQCLRSFKYMETTFHDLNINDPKMIKEGDEYFANNIQFYQLNLKAFNTQKEKYDIDFLERWSKEGKYKSREYNNKIINDCDERRKKIDDRSPGSYRAELEQYVSLLLSTRKSRWTAFEPLLKYKLEKVIGEGFKYYQRELFVDKKSAKRTLGGTLKVLVYELGEDMSLSINGFTGEQLYEVTVYELDCPSETYQVTGLIELVEPIQAQNVYKVYGRDQLISWSYFRPNSEVDKLFDMFCN